MRMVEIHDNALSKWIVGNSCQCAKDDHSCSITAVDWSPTGNSFIMLVHWTFKLIVFIFNYTYNNNFINQERLHHCVRAVWRWVGCKNIYDTRTCLPTYRLTTYVIIIRHSKDMSCKKVTKQRNQGAITGLPLVPFQVLCTFQDVSTWALWFTKPTFIQQ